MWATVVSLLRSQRRLVIVLIAGSVLTGLTESGVLAILAQTATGLVNRASVVNISLGPVHASARLGVLVAIGLALSLVRLALQVVISVVPAKMATNTQERFRRDVFGAFTRSSWAEQSRDREGHLQELLTNQVAQATQIAVQAGTIIVVTLTFVILVISALILNVIAAVVVLVAAVVLSMGLRPLSRLGGRRARAMSQASIQFAGGINEAVRLAEESHVFGTAPAQRKRTDALLHQLHRPYFHTQTLARFVPGVYQSLIYLLVMAALGALYLIGSAHVVSLGAVVLLLVRAGAYGQQGQAAVQALRQALPYVERLQQAEERYDQGTPVTGQRPLADVESLALRHVSFSYDGGRPVLSNISFAVSGGETVGVIGPSGTGKSTLVQILLGLRRPDTGSYLVNGEPAEEFARQDWHQRIAYVPQEPRLLHASVADNVRFFRQIDDDAVERATRLAGIHDDVMSWRDRYDTIIGPRADAISGGQQQRICLARALAAEPQILVLDEPTSALDPNAEALIQRSLMGLKGKLTLFIVAHRMSTLDVCGRVMVIVDGRLESFDTLAALKKKSPYYRSATAGRSSSDLFGRRRPWEPVDNVGAPSSGLVTAMRNRISGPGSNGDSE
jgi:ABC-type multidrug transport system fused ATPase/permease subunit